MYEDQTFVCKDCGKEFVWTAGEQEFFAQRGLQNRPQRCLECRRAAKAARNNSTGAPREMYTIVCANCGKEDQVPFPPRGDKPVYCNDCFKAMRR